MIVVDASAALEVLLRTAAGRAIEDRIFDPAESLHAPHLIDVEVAQVLRRYARTGKVDLRHCRAALADFTDLPVTLYPHDLLLRRVWDLRDNLTAFDAVYIALAEMLDAPLLTHDRRVAAAPVHQAKIQLV